jgi:hypothetical protein
MHIHAYAASIDLAGPQLNQPGRPRRDAAFFCRCLETLQRLKRFRDQQHDVFHTCLHKYLRSSSSRAKFPAFIYATNGEAESGHLE